MSLRSKVQDKLNSEFSKKFTSNDVDHHIYIFKRTPELREFPRRELMEVILSDSSFFDQFCDSVMFQLNNKNK